jgi:hypothetical protein
MNPVESLGPGIKYFNEGRFFEAHEEWERLWLAESGAHKTFLQGLIQLAAALHHHARGNPSGAEALFAAAIAKLEQFPGDYQGLALAELRSGAGEWLLALRSGDFRRGRALLQIHAISTRRQKVQSGNSGEDSC